MGVGHMATYSGTRRFQRGKTYRHLYISPDKFSSETFKPYQLRRKCTYR